MRLREWVGAAVEPAGDGRRPVPDEWHPVDVPGRPERFAGADAVAYRTRLPDPRSGDDERAVVTLTGCYAHARVWLDGDLLGAHDTYFTPARFVIEPTADAELLVECRAPEDRFGGVHDGDLVPDSRAVPGIWWGARVESVPSSFVRSLRAVPRLTDSGASIDVLVAVDAGTTLDERATISVRPEGFRGGGVMERARVTADAGERVMVRRTVDLRDPTCWWPADLGPQHRYTVAVSLGTDERTVTTGLCDVSRDEDGVRINGRRLPLRGVNLFDCDEPREDVERAAAANANLIRAHAHVPPHDLHSACDDAGLLVWQDLPLTGPGGYDVDRGKGLARALGAEYGHHPSLAVYGVHDDPRVPFDDGVGPGRLARCRAGWRCWRTSYDHTADDRVADALPGQRPVVPVAGPPGAEPDALHLYPGWEFGDASDVEWLLDRYGDDGAIVSEFGTGAFADEPVDTAAGFDRAKHDAYVDADSGASQAYQARVLKTVAEHLRRRSTHATIACALRDTDDAGFGVLAADGAEKRGYAALAESFEPVQAVLRTPSRSGRVPVTVINDTHEAIAGTFEWAVDGAGDTASIAVEALSKTDADAVDIPVDADELVFRLSLSDRTVVNRYPL